MTLDQIIDGYYVEAGYDGVDMWQIASRAKRDLGARTRDETIVFGLEIARRLYERGVRPADYQGGPDFHFWPDEGCQAMLDRIRREWIALGQDPMYVSQICSFFLPRT